MTKEEKAAKAAKAANVVEVIAAASGVVDQASLETEETTLTQRSVSTSGKRVNASGMVSVALVKAWHKDADEENGLKEKHALLSLTSDIEYEIRVNGRLEKVSRPIRALTLSAEQLRNLAANSDAEGKNIPDTISKLQKMCRPRPTAKGIEYATLLFDVLLEEGKPAEEASIIPSQIVLSESAQDRADKKEDIILQEKIRQRMLDELGDID